MLILGLKGLTDSLKKCMEISLENLYMDIGA